MRQITITYDERTGELLTETPEDAAFLNEKIRGLNWRTGDDPAPMPYHLTDHFHPIRTR